MTGGPVPPERTLDLAGYPGGVGKTANWVKEQFQLDAFGEALQLLAAAARLDRLGADGQKAARAAADAIAGRWTEPDAGIWELDNRLWDPFPAELRGRLARGGRAAVDGNWVRRLRGTGRRHDLAAIRYFERNRAACGPPGLLSEEYDVTQRQLRGNLPQAFVHALLLECAATLTGSERDLPEISAVS